MENASKALIIAGAILLAIVIISLGLIVVNNTRGVADSANLSEQEIQAFNAKFTPYEGSNKTGTQVKTLLQTVIAANNASGKSVSITSKKKTSGGTLTEKTNASTNDDISLVSASVTGDGKYDVTLGYSNSLVNGITIQEK